MSARRHVGLKTKLAATLCQMLVADDDGNLVPAISYERAKEMSEDEILSLFDFDHFPIRHADGGPDAHWNLRPLPRDKHRLKTSGTKATSAGSDIHAMAKGKRLTRDQEEFRRAMLAKSGQAEEPERKRSKWAKRPFPKRPSGPSPLSRV